LREVECCIVAPDERGPGAIYRRVQEMLSEIRMLQGKAAAMTPEQIVRALAAADPTVYEEAEERFACTVCGDYKRERGYLDLEDHAADCPWRLAVEWVSAQAAAPKWGGISITADPAQPRGTFKAMYPLPEGAMFLPGGSTVEYVLVDGLGVWLDVPVVGPGWFVYNAETGTLDHVSPQYFEGQWHPRP
jgi:hypothetical protein